ncbi:P22 phage major capsid protein family protein [Sphingomonas sp. R86520]|uniref:P22 phage major capsid protein family protein n=1 Tax=Sphingomonas sp. R86520 TaxID=3093859 RepID=UPI0036D3863A
MANDEVYRDDQPIRLAAAAGGATTVNGANQYWEPAAFTTEPDGEQVNRDNRYSQLVVTAAAIAWVKQGDAFADGGRRCDAPDLEAGHRPATDVPRRLLSTRRPTR